MLTVLTDASSGEELASTLDEICREGARRMLAVALEVEVDDHLNALRGELDEHGRRLVVRNGHARPRTITTAAGAVPIRGPRVNDKRVDADSGAEAVPFLDHRPLVPQEPEGVRSAAAAVPARHVHR